MRARPGPRGSAWSHMPGRLLCMNTRKNMDGSTTRRQHMPFREGGGTQRSPANAGGRTPKPLTRSMPPNG